MDTFPKWLSNSNRELDKRLPGPPINFNRRTKRQRSTELFLFREDQTSESDDSAWFITRCLMVFSCWLSTKNLPETLQKRATLSRVPAVTRSITPRATWSIFETSSTRPSYITIEKAVWCEIAYVPTSTIAEMKSRGWQRRWTGAKSSASLGGPCLLFLRPLPFRFLFAGDPRILRRNYISFGGGGEGGKTVGGGRAILTRASRDVFNQWWRHSAIDGCWPSGWGGNRRGGLWRFGSGDRSIFGAWRLSPNKTTSPTVSRAPLRLIEVSRGR